MRVPFACLVGLLAAGVVACGKSDNGGPPHIDIGDTGSPADSSADSSTNDSATTKDSNATTDSAHGDSSVGDSFAVDSSDAADATDTNDAGPDLGPPIDAIVIETKSDALDKTCENEHAWWAVSPAFDATVTPSSFATQVNPLIASGHPVTIADRNDPTSGWIVQVSATITGGDFAQHFPGAHAPSALVGMTRTGSGFSTATAETSGFLFVRDAASSDVWIPISKVVVRATYGDLLCESLASSSTLDAVIPSSAGSTAITTSSGATTLGTLLGAPTSSSPPGWNVRLGFAGEKVQVSWK